MSNLCDLRESLDKLEKISDLYDETLDLLYNIQINYHIESKISIDTERLSEFIEKLKEDLEEGLKELEKRERCEK